MDSLNNDFNKVNRITVTLIKLGQLPTILVIG